MSRASPFFVLMHGWGFDAGVWDGVTALLPKSDFLALDCGYFNAPRMTAPPKDRPPKDRPPKDRPLIAVGHSFGAMLLLSRLDVVWSGFVSINGFARFAFADDYPGARRRLIDQMVKRFDESPAMVLAEFRARCGADEPAPGAFDCGLLASGLRALRDDDARDRAAALTCPALLLAGDADPIVTPEMTRASAACFRYATTEWRSGGGHLLPRLAPDWCVGHLTAFAREASARCLTGEAG